jgi:hypothetical protein
MSVQQLQCSPLRWPLHSYQVHPQKPTHFLKVRLVVEPLKAVCTHLLLLARCTLAWQSCVHILLVCCPC